MGVRQNLGKFYVSFGGEITYDYDTGTLYLPKNDDYIDSKFDELKNAILNEVYPDYSTYEEDDDGTQRVIVQFSDVGIQYIFENSSAGFLFKVRQPLYKDDYADFKERVYIVIPRFSVDSVSFTPAVSLKITATTQNSSCLGCSFNRYVTSIKSATIELDGALLSSNSLIKPITKIIETPFQLTYVGSYGNCVNSGTIATSASIFMRAYTDSDTRTSIKAKFYSALRLSFFDRLIGIDYNYQLNGDYEYSFKVEFYGAITSEIENTDVSEDNYSQLIEDGLLYKLYPESYTVITQAKENINIQESEISFEVDSYVGFDFAKFLEGLSSIKPEFKVDYPTDQVDELNKFAGKSVFVVYPDMSTYDIRTFIKAEVDSDANGDFVKVILDNFPKYDVVNNTSYIIWGIGGDAAYQPSIDVVRESYFYQVNPDGSIEQSPDYFIRKNFSNRVVYSGITYGICVQLVDVLMLSGKSLGEIDKLSIANGEVASSSLPSLGVLSSVNVTQFPTPILVGLPFVHISKEDFDSMNVSFDFLDFAKIPDIKGVGAVKPLLITMPHPSGNGYIIPVKLPNFVATNIKDYLGYSPSTLLINATPDMAIDDEAFIAVRVFEKYSHDVYLIIGSLQAAGKPFKVMTFD